MKGNCLVAQSGGPTVAINASLAGVFSGLRDSGKVDKIYGGMNGIEGIIGGKLIDLSPIFAAGDNLEILKTTPSSFLGSCRYKLKSEEQFKQIFEMFSKFNIKYFFYIGGNDSMDTIHQLDTYQKKHGGDVIFVGVPKTIDNDLMYIDHTPGFGSAAKYIATAIKEVALDIMAYDKKFVGIVEVMGRNAGWLALSAALATNAKGESLVDMIYFPEITFSYEKMLEDIERVMETKKQVLIVVSEGIKNSENKLIADMGEKDSFGHSQLGGVAKQLENEVKKKLGVKVRAIELSLLQRSAAHFLSARDIEESFKLGEKAAELGLSGLSGIMVVCERKQEDCYCIEMDYKSAELIANKEKIVPSEYMNEEKNHASESAIEYLLPLIQGEKYPPIENGLPKYLSLSDFI